MKKYILYTILALAALSPRASAQTLSVSVEAAADAGAQIVVSVSGAMGMTALQFNLSLPEGTTFNETAIVKGDALDGHELAIRPLSDNNRLFVLYSLENKMFTDGTLLRLPLTIDGTDSGKEGKLYLVRTATPDAVSHTCGDTQFTIDPVIRGDVNGDGVVNGTDIQAIINFIVAGQYDVKGDVNEDGNVNGTDIQEVINIIVNGN